MLVAQMAVVQADLKDETVVVLVGLLVVTMGGLLVVILVATLASSLVD